MSCFDRLLTKRIRDVEQAQSSFENLSPYDMPKVHIARTVQYKRAGRARMISLPLRKQVKQHHAGAPVVDRGTSSHAMHPIRSVQSTSGTGSLSKGLNQHRELHNPVKQDLIHHASQARLAVQNGDNASIIAATTASPNLNTPLNIAPSSLDSRTPPTAANNIESCSITKGLMRQVRLDLNSLHTTALALLNRDSDSGEDEAIDDVYYIDLPQDLSDALGCLTDALWQLWLALRDQEQCTPETGDVTVLVDISSVLTRLTIALTVVKAYKAPLWRDYGVAVVDTIRNGISALHLARTQIMSVGETEVLSEGNATVVYVVYIEES